MGTIKYIDPLTSKERLEIQYLTKDQLPTQQQRNYHMQKLHVELITQKQRLVNNRETK
jgi:hypothetical protein